MRALGMIFLVIAIVSLAVGCVQRAMPVIQGPSIQIGSGATALIPISFWRFSIACILIAIAAFLAEISRK